MTDMEEQDIKQTRKKHSSAFKGKGTRKNVHSTAQENKRNFDKRVEETQRLFGAVAEEIRSDLKAVGQ